MGKQIHLKRILELFEKSPVVEFKSIERIIGKSNKSSYSKLLVSNLIKSGKIKKVSKGVYTKHNEISLAVFPFKPAYIGLQSSLSYHGCWEQETIPVIITTKRVRTGIREVMGANVLIRNINLKYFFGFQYVKEESFYLPYSDLEKTLIDMVFFNQKIDEEVLKDIKKKINNQKLLDYLSIYPARTKSKIMRLITNNKKSKK